MKTLPRLSLLLIFFLGFSLNAAFAQSGEEGKTDYLIVVSNSADKSANEKVLSDLKDTFKDAGMYYDADSKQYYVYVERYYSKSGADYALWWLKKQHKELPKVWAKQVPAGSK